MNYFIMIQKARAERRTPWLWLPLAAVCLLAGGMPVSAAGPGPDAGAAKAKPSPELSSAPLNAEEMTRQAIRERVAVLRSERIEKMPYLDKAFVRASINDKTLEAEQSFAATGPKTLQQIIDRAVQVYMPARVAHEKEELAKRRIITALRNLLPSASMEYTNEEGNLSQSGYNRRNAVFKFRQPVFHGGILWNTLLKERATLKQNIKEREQVISDLVQDVSKAYFEYERALLAVEERKSLKNDSQRYRELSQKKWDAKIVSEIEQLNVQSMVSQMDYDYETAVQELELARLELQKYLSLDSEEPLQIARLYDIEKLLPAAPPAEAESAPADSVKTAQDAAGQPAKAPKEPKVKAASKSSPGYSQEEIKIPSVEKLVDMAYQNRPELQMAAARLRAAQLEERIQWGAMLPEVDVIMEDGKDSEAYDANAWHPSFKPQYKIGMEFKWNMGGNRLEYDFNNNKTPPSLTAFQAQSGSLVATNTLKVGLLDGLDVFANTKNAEVEKLDQVVELDKAEQEVIKSVKEAYYDFQKASIQLKSGIQRLNYRERLLRFSKHRMEKNEIEISEYLQAAQEFSNQKVEVHKTLSEYYAAKAKLNRAVGQRDFLAVEKGNV